MARSRGWRDGIDAVDASLLDDYQSGFPVAERPYRVVGDRLGVAEDDLFERVERLLREGLVRRVGPVLNPPVIGSSTLAALRVPDGRFDAVADAVNAHPQVNHNYRRDHAWNTWFVVTAGSRVRRDEVVARIERETGLDALVLPLRTEYYIDLEFPVVNDDRVARERETGVRGASPTPVREDAMTDLSQIATRLIRTVHDGFPGTATPYRHLANELGVHVDDVLATVENLLDRRAIKRIGLVVNHRATGFSNNSMVVWDVPAAEVDDRGVAAGRLPFVTYACRRRRRPERGWQYNLFTMLHGRDRATVDAHVDHLASDVLPYDHARLTTTDVLKQTGARYEALLDA
ncbi:Lrp/AsnC family transcriptional regulator [Halobacteriaceae archaeon GCM10025711]